MLVAQQIHLNVPLHLQSQAKDRRPCCVICGLFLLEVPSLKPLVSS